MCTQPCLKHIDHIVFRWKTYLYTFFKRVYIATRDTNNSTTTASPAIVCCPRWGVLFGGGNVSGPVWPLLSHLTQGYPLRCNKSRKDGEWVFEVSFLVKYLHYSICFIWFYLFNLIDVQYIFCLFVILCIVCLFLLVFHSLATSRKGERSLCFCGFLIL